MITSKYRSVLKHDNLQVQVFKHDKHGKHDNFQVH